MRRGSCFWILESERSLLETFTLKIKSTPSIEASVVYLWGHGGFIGPKVLPKHPRWVCGINPNSSANGSDIGSAEVMLLSRWSVHITRYEY